MAPAIKKIKKAIEYEPLEDENWLIWGLIMRTCGNFWNALHKYKRALKLNPNNETAWYELEYVEKLIELEVKIPDDIVFRTSLS
jgi:tetratricopeptide (TPR) repeat protein